MTLKTIILSSLRNLRRNLNRSVLTMLGIIIGIAAVITIVALGEAYKSKTIEDFTGKDKESIVLNATFTPKDTSTNPNQSYFTDRDGNLLKGKEYIESFELLHDDQAFGALINVDLRGVQVQCIIGSFEETNNEDIIGRNLNKIDNDRVKKVAVINESILPKDSDAEQYLGGIITLDNNNCEIVGIIPSKENEASSLFSFEPNIKVPKKTYEKFSSTNNIIYGIQITLKKDADVNKSIDDIEKTLNEGGSKKELGKYEVFDNSGVINVLGTVLNTITTFIAVVAGISLFIAGIGVMNMVYTSVSERTLEIGIKRALGAKKKDIKREFLFEGIMITLSGGFIGYVLGILIAVIVSFFLKLSVKPSITTVTIAISVSVIVGIASSLLPAKKAANQNTIDILK